MPKKKPLSKVKKKVPKKTKVKKKIKPIKRKIIKKIEEKELIFKTKPEWVKSALVNKARYQKKYSDSIKNNINTIIFFKSLFRKYLSNNKK